MAIKKPFGITLFAGVLTVVGGISAVITIIELIDSIRFFGPNSIGISSLMSFFGFIIFAITPIVMYSAGIGLFLSQFWAWQASVYVLPALLFCFFANLAYVIAADKTIVLNPTFFDILSENTDVFVNMFVRYLFLVFPFFYYFTRPTVVFFFEQALPKKD